MDEVEVTRNGRTNQFSVTPVHGSDPIRCIVSVASVSIQDERSDWASKTPIVVHPFLERSAMVATRFSTLPVLPATLCLLPVWSAQTRIAHHSSGWSGAAWRHKQ